MKVAHSTTSSTDTSQDDRSDADRAAFQAASHVRIPTARGAAGSYTRETLDAAIRAADGDGDGPVIPKMPGPRQPSHAYDDVVLGAGLSYGQHAYLTALGAA